MHIVAIRYILPVLLPRCSVFPQYGLTTFRHRDVWSHYACRSAPPYGRLRKQACLRECSVPRPFSVPLARDDTLAKLFDANEQWSEAVKLPTPDTQGTAQLHRRPSAYPSSLDPLSWMFGLPCPQICHHCLHPRLHLLSSQHRQVSSHSGLLPRLSLFGLTYVQPALASSCRASPPTLAHDARRARSRARRPSA